MWCHNHDHTYIYRRTRAALIERVNIHVYHHAVESVDMHAVTPGHHPTLDH